MFEAISATQRWIFSWVVTLVVLHAVAQPLVCVAGTLGRAGDKARGRDREERRSDDSSGKTRGDTPSVAGRTISAVRTRVHDSGTHVESTRPRSEPHGNPGGRVHRRSPSFSIRHTPRYCPPPVSPSVVVVESYSQPIVAQPVIVQSVVPVPPPAPAYVPAVPEPVLSEPVMAPDWESPVALPPSIVPCDSVRVLHPSRGNARLRADFGSDFDDIGRFGMAFLAAQSGGWGIDVAADLYWESIDDEVREHMWVGDINLVYEWIRMDDFRSRAGLGVNWLHDSWGGEAGINFTVGADLWLTDVWSVSGELDLGTIGNATHFHGRLTTGVWFGNSQWFVGIDQRDIDTVQIHQWVTGMTVAF